MDAVPADRSTVQPPAEQLVKVAFLVRLISLLVAVLRLAGDPPSAALVAAVLLLSAASYLGLAVPRARELLVRHPMLAMADLGLVVWVVALFGVGSPLVLATVSTAILIGILYPLPFAVLPAGVLLLVHAVQTLADHRTGRDDFVVGLGMTTVLAVMVLVGQAVRRIQDGERRALARLSVEREAAAAERERVRLAREVHDGMAKSLQGLALVAAGLPAWVERDADRAMTQARCLAEGAAQAVEEARSLLAQLRTDDVALPLDAVVRQLCDQWSIAAGRPVAVDARSVPDIGVQPRYEVLAALREALENVRRHAPDAQVSVTFGPDGGGLRAEVVDDGPGFAPVTLQLSEAHGHFGVRGMHERLASIGGSARVDSASGRGTRVLLRLPAPGAPVAASGARRGRRLARLRRARLARVVRRSQVAR